MTVCFSLNNCRTTSISHLFQIAVVAQMIPQILFQKINAIIMCISFKKSNHLNKWKLNQTLKGFLLVLYCIRTTVIEN